MSRHVRLPALGAVLAVLFLAGCGKSTREMAKIKQDYHAGKVTTAAEVEKAEGKAFRRVLSDHADATFKSEWEATFKPMGGLSEEKKTELFWDKQVEIWWYEVERNYAQIEFVREPEGKLRVVRVTHADAVDYKSRPYEKVL